MSFVFSAFISLFNLYTNHNKKKGFLAISGPFAIIGENILISLAHIINI